MSDSQSKITIDAAEMNRCAAEILLAQSPALEAADNLRRTCIDGATVWDFGVNLAGSDAGGILLAKISTGDQLDVKLEDIGGRVDVVVASDRPVQACLGSQYAGWPVSAEKYFAMASGPGRILRGKEALWNHFSISPSTSDVAVLVLESDQLPDSQVIQKVASDMNLQPEQMHLCVAPTNSKAGTLQIVARSLETALHQWEVQHGPLTAIRRGEGRAPLPPTGKNSLVSIGLTNDAIIYGGEVSLFVDGDWNALLSLAKAIPSENSSAFGQSFMDLFEAAGKDFYKMDARLFSPAVLKLKDIRSEAFQTFGNTRMELTVSRAND